jgi:serine/threonine protein kinase
MKKDRSIESLDALIEDFQERLRRGELPSIPDYASRYPDYKDEILEIFPTLQTMEELKTKRELLKNPRQFPGFQKLNRLGEYRIVREIGRGGMGIVFEAFQETLNRRVAIKVLPWLSLVDESLVKRFEREAKVSASLEYPHIIPIYGFGNHEGIYYYAMQYIRGVNLNDLIAYLASQRQQDIPDLFGIHGKTEDSIGCHITLLKNLVEKYFERNQEGAEKPETIRKEFPGTLDRSQVFSRGLEEKNSRYLYARLPPAYYKEVGLLISQVANALHYAHEQKSIHRDIKPSNLLLDTQGMIWIADFGLAKEVFSEKLTVTGNMLGTVRYMAPECFDGKYDARSDIYGLGLSLCEMLTLQPVFSENGGRLLQRIIMGQISMPRINNPHIPSALETIVRKALMTDPNKRYQSGRTMENDLKLFIEGQAKGYMARQTEQKPDKKPIKKQRFLPGSFYGYLVALLVVAALFLYRFWPSSTKDIDVSSQAKSNQEQNLQVSSRKQEEKTQTQLKTGLETPQSVETGQLLEQETTQPANRPLTPEQRAARRAESRANWEALSREEKAARRGHKMMPSPPAEPANPAR